MISENLAMRYRRLAFYAEDIDKFNDVLSSFVKKSNAICAMLIDHEGHMVAKQGFFDSMDTTTLSALVAGSFASTRQVAKILGETEFQVLYHKGEKNCIMINLVRERTLQVTVFDSTTKQGFMQVMCGELADKTEKIIDEIADRPRDEEKEKLDSGYNEAVNDELDNLFGGL